MTTNEDLSSNFFLDIDDIGKNRAEASLPKLKELNAHVNITCLNIAIENINDDIINEYSLIVLTNVSLLEQIRINNICRDNKIAFFATEAMGYEALLFVDFGLSHKYRTEAGTGESLKLSDEIEMNCPSLEEANDMPWNIFLKQRFGFLSKAYVHSRIISSFRSTNNRYPTINDAEQIHNIGKTLLEEEQVDESSYSFSKEEAYNLTLTCSMEIAPVCAIMGGVLGQEVVKYVSFKGAPISNFFALDAVSGEGKVKLILETHILRSLSSFNTMPFLFIFLFFYHQYIYIGISRSTCSK